MSNLVKEIRKAITDGDVNHVIELLDQGAPMTIEHFALATQMKRYGVLDWFLRHNWNINADIDSILPSALA